MKINFDGCNFESETGPNSFALLLARKLSMMGHILVDDNNDPAADVQLSFIIAQMSSVPIALRLDGIYFNTEQEWEKMNEVIAASYHAAAAVIAQSQFNAELLKRYFGDHPNMHIVSNGVDVQAMQAMQLIDIEELDKYDCVWCCASSWRPHKRLAENIRYFLEHASQNDCLVVVGENADSIIADSRIFYAGQMANAQLLSLMKRSQYFIHLALLDHCPNVVLQARAAGCRIICTDSGGTKEIAGTNSVIIKDMQWDWKPFELYKPPKLDFSKKVSYNHSDRSIDISRAAIEYEDILLSIVV